MPPVKSYVTTQRLAEVFRAAVRGAYANALAPYLQVGREHKVLVLSRGRSAFRLHVMPRLLEVRPKHVLEFNLGRASLSKIPHEKDAFDVVVAESALDRLPDHQLAGAMREIARVLKPGGRFVHVQDVVPRFRVHRPSRARSTKETGKPLRERVMDTHAVFTAQIAKALYESGRFEDVWGREVHGFHEGPREERHEGPLFRAGDRTPAGGRLSFGVFQPIAPAGPLKPKSYREEYRGFLVVARRREA